MRAYWKKHTRNVKAGIRAAHDIAAKMIASGAINYADLERAYVQASNPGIVPRRTITVADAKVMFPDFDPMR